MIIDSFEIESEAIISPEHFFGEKHSICDIAIGTFSREIYAAVLERLDCHCLELYFVMKSKGNTELDSNSINSVGAVEHMKWIPVDEIDQYNIKPSFLKERLLDIIESNQILHIISPVDRTSN